MCGVSHISYQIKQIGGIFCAFNLAKNAAEI